MTFAHLTIGKKDTSILLWKRSCREVDCRCVQ